MLSLGEEGWSERELFFQSICRIDQMILGLGIDIIEVARIKASHEKFGERFLNRILRPDEISYCLSHKQPSPFLAARFAAKEAASNASATGIAAQLGCQDVEFRRTARLMA